VGREIAVGVATCYGLEGPAIESRCGPPNFLYKWYRLSYPRVERPGHDVGAEVKERVQLYLYSPSGNLWVVLAEHYSKSCACTVSKYGLRC